MIGIRMSGEVLIKVKLVAAEQVDLAYT